MMYRVLGTPILLCQFTGHYNIERDEISVSGLSSGAFFAVQFHVAYSSTIMGVAAVAGGILYLCLAVQFPVTNFLVPLWVWLAGGMSYGSFNS